MSKIIIDEITSEKLEALGWTPPAKPEIPEGCPVLVWDDEDDKKQHCVYKEFISERKYSHRTIEGSYWRYCEIDYTRKGCVIPWNGGECPVDDDAYVTYWVRRREQSYACPAGDIIWSHDGSNGDIIAFLIWPDYVTIEDKG